MPQTHAKGVEDKAVNGSVPVGFGGLVQRWVDQRKDLPKTLGLGRQTGRPEVSKGGGEHWVLRRTTAAFSVTSDIRYSLLKK
jgi:hypothetical protein